MILQKFTSQALYVDVCCAEPLAFVAWVRLCSLPRQLAPHSLWFRLFVIYIYHYIITGMFPRAERCLSFGRQGTTVVVSPPMGKGRSSGST